MQCLEDNGEEKVEIRRTMNETESLYETNDNVTPLHIVYDAAKSRVFHKRRLITLMVEK